MPAQTATSLAEIARLEAANRTLEAEIATARTAASAAGNVPLVVSLVRQDARVKARKLDILRLKAGYQRSQLSPSDAERALAQASARAMSLVDGIVGAASVLRAVDLTAQVLANLLKIFR